MDTTSGTTPPQDATPWLLVMAEHASVPDREAHLLTGDAGGGGRVCQLGLELGQEPNATRIDVDDRRLRPTCHPVAKSTPDKAARLI